MGYRWMLVLLAVAILLPVDGWSEFYKYKDRNGTIHFTDNLLEVPPDQRPQVKRYTAPDDYLSPEERQAKLEKEKAEREAQAAEAARQERIKAGEMDPNDPNAFEYLSRTKQALDAEYAGLMKEKKALDAEKANIATREALKAYEDKVRDLNDRIKDFNRRRDLYKKNADAFNALAKPQ